MAAVIAALDADSDAMDLLPAVLARACVEVLPVAGAGISWTNELRIPLGASDLMAVRAERLQTTLGKGPCITASSTSSPLRATGALMALHWPAFYQELLLQTPYRTIVSVPLQSQREDRFGALDLCSTDDNVPPNLMVDEICAELADPIAAILFDDALTTDQQHGDELPAWLTSGPVRDRMTVWVAIGMLMEHGLTNTEALAMLRGYAYSHNHPRRARCSGLHPPSDPGHPPRVMTLKVEHSRTRGGSRG